MQTHHRRRKAMATFSERLEKLVDQMVRNQGAQQTITALTETARNVARRGIKSKSLRAEPISEDQRRQALSAMATSFIQSGAAPEEVGNELIAVGISNLVQ